jgi:hypothetical protein
MAMASIMDQKRRKQPTTEVEALQSESSQQPEVSSPSLDQKLGAAASLASKIGSSSSPVSSGLSGAAAGLTLGGPVGAAAGATLGVVGALASNEANRRAERRRIEADKWRAIGQIQESAGSQQAAILQNLIGSLRGSFTR